LAKKTRKKEKKEIIKTYYLAIIVITLGLGGGVDRECQRGTGPPANLGPDLRRGPDGGG